VTLEVSNNSQHDVWGVDRETLEARFAQLMDTDGYKQLHPDPDEVKILRKLSEDHEMHVITARREHERDITQHMLDTYLPGVFTSLELVGFHGSKGEVCKRLGADILIDDNARHLQNAIEHGISQENALLFGDYVWNAPSDANVSLTRCVNWTEVERKVDRLARQ
jgi:uncharacterized HAD superfamily protein